MLALKIIGLIILCSITYFAIVGVVYHYVKKSKSMKKAEKETPIFFALFWFISVPTLGSWMLMANYLSRPKKVKLPTATAVNIGE